MSQELNFDKSLENIKFIFLMTGLNIEDRKKKLKENLIFLFNFLWLNMDIACALRWTIIGIATGENFTRVTFVAPCFIMSILSYFKFLFLIRNETKVKGLISNLRALERRKNEFSNLDEDKIIEPATKFLDIVTKVLNVLNCLMIVVFDLSPLILIAVKYCRTGMLELMLPFMNIYPFDGFNLKCWPVMYIHQIWSECIALLNICATDYFFFTCCTHLRIQFKLLQRQFESCIPFRSLTDIETDREEWRAKFTDLIKWHQQIITSAAMLEDVYSKSTLFNFVTSSLLICLTGFNVMTIDGIAYIMTSMTFLFMSLLQVFFLCFFGDILVSSSLEVADSVYNSQWYLRCKRAGKNVSIIQARSQNPCKVTAAGFADVNLRAFMKILSTSWSYFALLQTIYSSRV